MIRNIQTLPSAGQTTGKTRQTPRRGEADFSSMLQRQLRDQRREETPSETTLSAAAEQAAVQAAAQLTQAAAIRQAMGIQPAPADTRVGGVHTAALNGAGTLNGTETLSGATRQTVNFSKHALARAEARGIQLTDALLDKLADSVEKAQEKGAKNILAFDTTQAFIINIPYSRVITAISQEELRENIFTNIDGAVLL